MSKKKNSKGQGKAIEAKLHVTTRKDYMDFVEMFPPGTEVAVRKEGGEIIIGMIAGPPEADEFSNLVVSVSPSEGELVFGISIDQIRPRQFEKRKTVQKLRVALTDKERMEAGSSIADLQQRGAELTADMKAEVKRMKVDIDSVTAQMLSHGERLRTGYELRSVDCELIIDYDRGTATEIRKDTGETVNTRGLYPSEQQTQIPLAGVTDTASDSQGVAQTQGPGLTVEKEPVTDDEVTLAIEIIRETQRASTSTIQRRMRINYTRASDIMDELEARGIVGPAKGDEPRDILEEEHASTTNDSERTSEN